mmetsp:Transcript_4014/g.12471  ORF Transcript_4014/g.12471 Transcript_4014/m.12471 type:complete len:419 (+) Transcript_4014:132-1388(+)
MASIVERRSKEEESSLLPEKKEDGLLLCLTLVGEADGEEEGDGGGEGDDAEEDIVEEEEGRVVARRRRREEEASARTQPQGRSRTHFEEELLGGRVGLAEGVVLELVGQSAPAGDGEPVAAGLDEHVVAAPVDLAEAGVSPVLAPRIAKLPEGPSLVVDAPADDLDDVVGVVDGARADGVFDDVTADDVHDVRGVDVARDGPRARDLLHDRLCRRRRAHVQGGRESAEGVDGDARIRRDRAEGIAFARVSFDAIARHRPTLVRVFRVPRVSARGHAVATHVLRRAAVAVDGLVGLAAGEGNAPEEFRPAPHAGGRAARLAAAGHLGAAVQHHLVRHQRVRGAPLVLSAQQEPRDLRPVLEAVVSPERKARAAIHGDVLILRRRQKRLQSEPRHVAPAKGVRQRCSSLVLGRRRRRAQH